MTYEKVNIYRSNGEWCYAAYTEEGFDSSDTLGIVAGATEAAANSAAGVMFPGADIIRVDDIGKAPVKKRKLTRERIGIDNAVVSERETEGSDFHEALESRGLELLSLAQSASGRATAAKLGPEGRAQRAKAGAAKRWGKTWLVKVQDRTETMPEDLFVVERVRAATGEEAIRSALRGKGWKLQVARYGISRDDSTTAIAISQRVIAQAWLIEE